MQSRTGLFRIILAFSFLHGMSFGQVGNWEDNSANPQAWTTGNVGIGTAVPSALLHVQDGISRFGSLANYGRFDASGNLRFFGSARYTVPGNTHALKSPNNSIGLYFNSTNNRLEFTNSAGIRMFSTDIAGTNAGDGYFNKNLTVVGTATAAAFVGDGSGLTGLPMSQWTTSGSNIYYNSGNVGIGTATPLTKLDINVGTSQLRVEGNGTTGNGVRFVNTDGGDQQWELLSLGTSGLAGPSKGFAVQDLTFSKAPFQIERNTPSATLYLQSSGNVGIGTTGPTTKLDVAGTITASAFVGDGSGLTGLPLSQWTTSDSNIYYNSGNVGIGTTSPAALLHMKGAHNSNRGQFTIESSELPQLTFYSGPTATSDLRAAVYYDLAGLFILNNYNGGSYGSIVLNPTSGYVSIGTTSPGAKLHVGGTLGVDGIMFPDGTLQTTAWTGAAAGTVNSSEVAALQQTIGEQQRNIETLNARLIAIEKENGQLSAMNTRVSAIEAALTRGHILKTSPKNADESGAEEKAGASPNLGASETMHGQIGSLQLEATPEGYNLSVNYPNPFNPNTRVEYALPQAGHVMIEIYSTLGQVVKTLVDGDKPAGYYIAEWDGNTEFGGKAASGTYVYRMQAGDYVQTHNMVLLK